jgi:hypothetical protein
MNRKRLVLYLIFAVYQVIAFIFTIMVDGHIDLLGLLRFIPWFKYMSFFGVALILTDFVWYWLDHRATKKKEDELQRENNVLKAKVYDYQEATKNADPSKKL